MDWVAAVILASAAVPLGWAWWANRRTSLAHALSWAALAYMTWGAAAMAYVVWGAAALTGERLVLGYLALCLTNCAGVAVLGARRPGVVAWNFVVAGLLIVQLLPLAEGFGALHLTWPPLLFLAGTLAVCVLNYLPTRLGPAALLVGLFCGTELWSLMAPPGPPIRWGWLTLPVPPWLALVLIKARAAPASEIDRTWLRFRDSFGALWAERTREQFNRAAANAGLAGRLGWRGLRGAPAAEHGQLLDILRAVLKRFGPAD